MTQPSLFEPAEEARLSKQCQRILERFQEKRRLSNVELSQIAMRYSARIFDLKKRGHQIRLVDRDFATGLTWYELSGA